MRREECFLCGVFPGQAVLCREMSGGRLDRHHLVPQRRLKVSFPRGAVLVDGRLAPLGRGVPLDAAAVTLLMLLADERNVILLGRWHHQQFEHRRVRIPREKLPAAVEEFARLAGMAWSLDRDYGRLAVAA